MKTITRTMLTTLSLALGTAASAGLPAASASNQLATDLYKELGENPGNLFFSPTSIAAAMSLAWAGAKEQTLTEMSTVLHLDALGDDAPAELKKLRESLSQDTPGALLRMANAAWVQQGYTKPAYLKLLDTQYGAPAKEVDFTADAEKLRLQINIWVEEQTNDLIKNLLPQGVIDDLTRLVLVNAIYFKGTWLTEFDPKKTRDAPFYTSKDENKRVPMMHTKSTVPYTHSGNASIVALPYKGDRLSMLLVVPDSRDGLAEIEAALDAKTIATWTRRLSPTKIFLWMPKFKMESSFSLSETLKKLGMPRAFSTTAQFGGISNDPQLYISAVIHKAFVEVNEEGTEAAATTAVVMSTRSIAPATPKVRADHPFLFMIRDNQTDAILFIGRVTDPTK